MRRELLLAILALGAAMLAQPALAQDDEGDSEPLGQSTIFIYEDGTLVGYNVGPDFEFDEVDDNDIDEGNAELLTEIKGYGPNRATVGASVAKNNEQTFAAEQTGAHPEGLLIHDFAYTDMLRPGDWQQAFGDWSSAKSNAGQYDYSTARSSLDASFYSLGGYVYGIGRRFGDVPYDASGHRSRRYGHAVWRAGSADGGSWTIEGTHYNVSNEDVAPQPSDVDLKRVDANFRLVECGLVLKGGAFYGKYESKYADSDNAFIGAKLDGEYCLAPDLSVLANADLTSTSADKQNANVTQSNFGAGLSWDLNDSVTVVGEAHSYDESNDLTANTHLTGFKDLSARMDVHPASGTNVSFGWRRRDADFERLHFGNSDVGLLAGDAEQSPTRADLAQYRTPDGARSDKLSFNGQWKAGDRVYIGAYWDKEKFDSLPAAENLFVTDPQPPYFQDSRSSSSLHMSYDTGGGGNLTLRGDEWSRQNGPRESSFDNRRVSLGYVAPLTSCTRWGAEVSRSQSNLDLSGDTQDLNQSSWNYGVNLSGYECWADYRISYDHELSKNSAGGDADSLGLELNLKQSPLYFSGWWRDRKDAMGGFADTNDSGISVGYRIDL